MDLKEIGWRMWAGFIWLRTGKRGWPLWTREWTFRFHETRGISWQAGELLVNQEALCSVELVTITHEVSCKVTHHRLKCCRNFSCLPLIM